MEEYRDIFVLPPTCLFRSDLIELQKLIKRDLRCKKIDFSVSTEINHRNVSSESVESLLQHELPRETKNMRIESRSWNEKNEIDAGLYVSMRSGHIHCQIHALSEIKFLGKKEQIEQFFRLHRPWYAILTRSWTVIFTCIAWSSIFSTAIMFKLGRYLPAILSLILLITVSFAWMLAYNNRLFPYVRIYFSDKKGWPIENIAVIIQALLLISTLISFFVKR